MKPIVLIIGITLLITSCAPVYVPNVRNVPLFRGAGEFQGSFHLGNGIDLQAAASVTDHIGIMGNYSWVNRTSTNSDSDYLKHKLFEGGIGYYSNTEKLCYEIFAGYGQGEGVSYDTYDFSSSTNDVRATGEYNRFFIQPSVGSNHRTFNWAVSFRTSIVNMTDFVLDGTTYSLPNNEPFIFFEPAFTGKLYFGDSGIFSAFQTGFSLAPQGTPYFDYSPFSLSIGFGVRFGGKPKLEYRE